jgi:DNA-entry nuclease
MPTFDIDSIPEYSKSPFAEVNGNVPFFTENQFTTSSYEYYSPLDSLGRCGITVACIGRDIMPTEGRGDISSVKPTGWVQATYNGNYLYNRSHLIGFQLTGENANKENLITGTAYFNVTGMLAFENMVADYVKETRNHVLYRVTPVFVGKELVARGVLMEAWSVEDNGKGICFNVFIYNVQPGVEIDYATGKSHAVAAPDTGDSEKTNYVANKNSKKFHLPSCTWVAKMNEANKEYITATHDEMIANGYSPCGTCNP